MDADSLSGLTLACSGCSHSQIETTSPQQPDRDPLARLCSECSVLQRCRTNCLPNEAEWAQINALVEDARSKITQLDQEILQKHQLHMRADLEQKRDDLQRFIRNAQSLAAPVRKLPLEVLYKIFELLFVSEPSLSILETFDRLGTRTCARTLDLSQVCAFWRAAVLLQPALWASLSIDLQKVVTNEMSQLVLYHIQCSRPQPLRLNVFVPPVNGETSPLAYHLLESFLAESERWYEVWICANNRAMSLLSSRTPWMSFPRLKKLKLRWEILESDDEIRVVDMFSLSDFPELLECRINSFSPEKLGEIRMPNLTKLELQFHYLSHPLAALLHNFPNLRECQIHALADFRMRRGPNYTLVDFPPHYHLRRLELDMYDDFASLGPFLHSLSLPCLESFSLTNHAPYVAAPLPSTGFLPVLNHSRLALNDLTLKSLDEQKILQILNRLPSLTSLSLQNIANLSPALFEQLTLTSDMPNLVPQLKSLYIMQREERIRAADAWFLHPEASTLDLLCDMVESRRGSSPSSGALLEHLTLGLGYIDSFHVPLKSLPPNHRLRERLQPLVDAGLSLRL